MVGNDDFGMIGRGVGLRRFLDHKKRIPPKPTTTNNPINSNKIRNNPLLLNKSAGYGLGGDGNVAMT